MKNTFLNLSLVYWLIIFAVVFNIYNSPTFYVKYLWVVLSSAAILYLVLSIVNYFVLNHDKKVLLKASISSDNITYYESKFQYQIILTVLLFVFIIMTIFDIGGLGKISIYFLGLNVFALVFLLYYRTSTFELTATSLIWKKGNLTINSPWNEVIGVHYDWTPSISNASRGFKSTSFFIETKKGLTAYVDKASIKRKGIFTFSSIGDELISEIKKRSSAIEKTGAVSMFKQTQKHRDIIFLLALIFLIPLFIAMVYVLVYGSI